MRIAIVNDLRIAVEAISRVLHLAPCHQVAWVAYDGAEAVARCARDRPDLILMDLLMPEMDGIEATRRIMARTPCAIVVVTASVNRGSSRVFEAMGAGALDAVNTPVLGIAGEAHNPHGLLGKIDTISRLVHGHRSPGRLVLNPAIRRVCRPCNSQLIAIGASAGGPAALASILASLPEDFPAGLVVVQHVDGCFAEDLARWLDRQTPLRVRVACEGDCPRAGTVLLAGGEQHLVFADPERLQYTQIPANGSYRPSIDVFMNSVLRHWQGDAIGVLLTGMGHDGAAGLKAFRECGCATIAQDEATSVVYGMPKAAVELDAADEILPLPEIGPHLLKSLNYRRHPHV